MDSSDKASLRTSQKLDLLIALFNRVPIRPILDGLDDAQLVKAHEFLWNKLVEIHYLTQRGEFAREEVTRNMVPSATYQHQQHCDLRLDYCKGVECILSNPICAGNKVKNNMEVMALRIVSYLEDSGESDNGANDSQQREEVNAWL